MNPICVCVYVCCVCGEGEYAWLNNYVIFGKSLILLSLSFLISKWGQ